MQKTLRAILVISIFVILSSYVVEEKVYESPVVEEKVEVIHPHHHEHVIIEERAPVIEEKIECIPK